ncbi:MAG: serine/threonine protein kinase [Proteobacteria bacterium]|jgi:serine/threonine-protein kinase|nr:serine/threonine protein kinase [Pseudomonadota bacterium]
MSQEQDQRIGILLDGKYELVRLIGEGGMGAVYEATHKLIGRRLAVKFLHASYASNPEVITRFQREAQAAAQIGHENIIEVTDMGTAPDGSPYLVMECLEGSDVKAAIEKEGRLSTKRTAHILVQALGALQAAHDVGIIHRDLKPENIFLTAKGMNPDYVKLLDFGISKFKTFDSEGVKGLTQTGTVLGTPHYMSPEQARGEQNLTPQSDIYAMGVILYQMLTGQLPFDAANYNALLIKILTEEPVAIEVLNPELPAELVDAVKKAMSRDTATRFQTCDELRDQLVPFAPSVSEIGTLVTSTSSKTVMRRALYDTKTPFEMSQSTVAPKRGSKRAMIFGAIGVAVVAAGVVVALSIGGGSKPPAAPEKVPVVVPAGPAEVQPKVESTAPPPVAAVVKVAITVTPAEARLSVDGAPLDANPFSGEFAKGDAVHLVEATADGYELEKRFVKFDADVELKYELKKIEAKPAGKTAAKTTKTAEQSAAGKGEAKSGKGKKPNRKIDYDDPWKN